ncbi:MAG: CDP-alcohol phosphatidyltransferase family protein [Myxococcota bacterium]
MPRPAWLSRANALTMARAASAPLLVLAILRDAPLVAAGLFALAVVTDLADGRVARRYGEATRLGALLDHATDALFVSAGLGALAHQGVVPGALPWLVAAAFGQYVLDSRSARRRPLGDGPLRASRLGRWNGIAYFVLLGIPVVRDALGLGWPPGWVVQVLGWLLVASTLVSMTDRALAWRRHRRQSSG